MPVIAEHHRWHLRTRTASYVVSVRQDGRLSQDHWGAGLSDEEAFALEAPADHGLFPSTFNVSSGDEVSVLDGRDIRSPSIDLTFPDGSRILELAFLDARAEADQLTLVLADRERGVELSLHYRVIDELDVIERRCTIRNTSDVPFEARSIVGCDVKLPSRATRLTSLPGRWCADPVLEQTPLIEGIVQLEGRGGFVGHRAKAWYAVDDGQTTEFNGEVWSSSLLWSGSWKLAIERTNLTELHAQLGIHDDGLSMVVEPSQTLETPAIAICYSDEGFDGLSASWHAYVRTRILPSAAPRPVIYNSWEAEMFDVDLAGQTELATRAASIGCELFVLDDGWFTGRTDEHGGLGDWMPDERKFPGGLRPLADHVHGLGMRFGLWVEPEMVSPRSRLFQEHPDWIYRAGDRTPAEMRGQLVLDLGREEVRDFVFSSVDRLVRDYDLDYLKWDFNRPITVAGTADTNAGVAAIEHVRRLYELIDDLRAAHPGLLIESCAGGGARADYGMLAHTDLVWPSDNTDPFDRLTLQRGFGHAFPAIVTSSWVTGSPSLLNGRSSPLDYRFHVSMCGVLGVGDDIRAWDDDQLRAAKHWIDMYTRNRELIQFGRMSRLAASTELSAVQFRSDDRERAIVLAFGHARRYGRAVQRIRLHGLHAARWYRTAYGRRFGGSTLMHVGLPIDLVGDLASEVIELQAV